jgi:aquaporin Z
VTLGVLLRRESRQQRRRVLGSRGRGRHPRGSADQGITSFGAVEDQTGGLGTDNWGEAISGSGAFVLQVVITFLLVFVVLLVTGRAAAPGFARLAIGLVLIAIHILAISPDGCGANPARSPWTGAVQRRRTAAARGCSSSLRLSKEPAAVVAPLVTPAVEDVAAEGEAIPRDTTGADVPHPDNRSRA